MSENNKAQQFPLTVYVIPPFPDPQMINESGAEQIREPEDNLIPAKHREAVKHATRTIRGCMQDIARNIFQVGHELTNVKQLLGHGRFGRWLQREFPGSERLAEHWMNVHQRLGSKADFFVRLQPTALYYLSMPSTPEEAIHMVEQALQAGERLDVKQVQAMIKACKGSQARQQKNASNRETASNRQETGAPRLQEILMNVLVALGEQTTQECQQMLGREGVSLIRGIRIGIVLLIYLIETKTQRTRYGQPGAATTPGWTFVRGQLAAMENLPFFVLDAVRELSDTEQGNIIDGNISSGDKIIPGCTVYVKEEDANQEVSYTIVEDEMGNPEQEASTSRVRWPRRC